MMNHKGGICPYSKEFKTCQEGFCEECQIYQEYKKEKEGKSAQTDSLHSRSV
jgi:hypothetical protein